MPAAPWKNVRREMPCCFDNSLPSSFTRASNSRCLSLCGAGMNSSLETACVGIGERNVAVSAGTSLAISSGDIMMGLLSNRVLNEVHRGATYAALL